MGGGHLGGIERRGCGDAAGEEMSRTGSSMYESVKSHVKRTEQGEARALGDAQGTTKATSV